MTLFILSVIGGVVLGYVMGRRRSKALGEEIAAALERDRLAQERKLAIDQRLDELIKRDSYTRAEK